MNPLKAFTVSCAKDITVVITSIQVIFQGNEASVDSNDFTETFFRDPLR